jgi:hypothetical protein
LPGGWRAIRRHFAGCKGSFWVILVPEKALSGRDYGPFFITHCVMPLQTAIPPLIARSAKIPSILWRGRIYSLLYSIIAPFIHRNTPLQSAGVFYAHVLRPFGEK